MYRELKPSLLLI